MQETNTGITSGFKFNESTGENKEFDRPLIPSKLYDVAHLKSYRVYRRKKDDAERMVWNFEIIGKNGAAVEIPGFTSTKFGITKDGTVATARKWAAAIQGLKPTDEVMSDMDALIGKPCKVLTTTIGEGDDEHSIVDVVFPAGKEDDIDF